MNQCKSHRENLLEYIESNLDKNQERALEKHLKTCSKCREELESLKVTLSLIDQQNWSIDPPEFLEHAVMDAAEAETRKHIKRKSWFSFMLSPLQGTAAIAILLLAVTGVILKNMSSPGEMIMSGKPSMIAPNNTEPEPGSSFREEKTEDPVDTETISGNRKDVLKSKGNKESEGFNVVFYRPEESRGKKETQPSVRRETGRIRPEAAAPQEPEEIVLKDESDLFSLGYSGEMIDELELEESLDHDVVQARSGTISYTLDVGVTAPIPIKRTEAEFPENLDKVFKSGNVKIKATIDMNGRLVDISVLESTHKAFSSRVLHALKEWRFKPGMRNQSPVNVPCTIVFQFSDGTR